MKGKVFFALTQCVCMLLLLCSCAAAPTADTKPNEDPKEDNALNVFFVSNSTCFYFTDELYGLLTAAGYEDVTLALVYYSGCPLQKHYEWWLSDMPGYQLRILDRDGLHVTENCSMREALKQRNWDVISFDNNARSFSSGDVNLSLANAEPYFGKLYQSIKELFPTARFFWHEVWANEIGYSLAFKMETVEQRSRVYAAKRGVARIMKQKYGVEIVPTGDAWEKVRDLELFRTPVAGAPIDKFTLCTRLQKGNIKDDFTHDGDIGGGQYLNACVWFEILTGESCLDNTFRPQYQFGELDLSLTEEKIGILKNAAHEAVSELMAE